MAGNKAFAAGIGSTNIDLLYTGLKNLPTEGEEVYADGFSLQLGGGAPATLLLLSKLGVPVKIITELGDDLFSQFARAQFAANGAEPVNLYTDVGMPLNISSCLVTARDRSFVSYGPGNPRADEAAQAAALEASQGAKVMLMQPGGFLPVYEKLKAQGTTLLFDCGWSEDLSLEKYRPYLELADYYTPNQKEACKLTNTSTPQAAAEVLAQYLDRVLVKLDRDGCLGYENGEMFTVPPVSFGKAVDATGAGDAFSAGFAYGLFHGYAFADCLLLGNITGGKCVSAVGCLGASLTEAELLERFRNEREKRGICV